MSLPGGCSKTLSVGPWGGHDGLHWNDGVYIGIRQLEIAHGAGVDSIMIEYDKNGISVWSEKHGGHGGAKTDRVKLDYPDEFLTSFHGYYGSLHGWGPVVVRSLTFESNKRKYGPYGVEQGTYFTLPTTQGKIVGFHGMSGWYVDAIGVHLEPLQKAIVSSFPLVSNPVLSTQHYSEKIEYTMIQGTGKGYEVLVAVRQKDDHNDSSLNKLLVQTLGNSLPDITSKLNLPEPKNKIPTAVPAKTETKPPKNVQIATAVPTKTETKPPKNVQGVVTYGPWGGSGGTPFDEGVYDGIRQINLKRNVGVVSIRVCYDYHREPVWGSKIGGTGSFKKDKIIFDYPSEILTHITGYYGPMMIMGPNIIKSLTFHTTKGKYGPYGEEQGQSFSTDLKQGVIVGFHGRKGLFLDAIGVHVLEKNILPVSSSPPKLKHQSPVLPAKVVPTPSPPVVSNLKNPELSPKPNDHKPAAKPAEKNNAQNQVVKDDVDKWSFKLGKRGVPNEVAQRVVKDPTPYGPGPWGGEGGKTWDDGVFTGIKQIILTRSNAICCIEIEYDRSGQSIWSVKHGGSGGQAANRIKLDYPNEVLTCITGYYGPLSKDQGTKVIKSLTFYTSRSKYGPFGEELGTYFTSATTEGKVVGFHGRSGMYLDAIGVHMQHWLGYDQRSHRPSTIMKIFS